MKNKNLLDIEEDVFNWRAMAGYVYLIICLFDFVVMPLAVHVEISGTTEIIEQMLDSREDREFKLDLISMIGNEPWSPVTLVGGGLFHLSFGAILTGAAVTRGIERREIVKQNGHYNNGGGKEDGS